MTITKFTHNLGSEYKALAYKLKSSYDLCSIGIDGNIEIRGDTEGVQAMIDEHTDTTDYVAIRRAFAKQLFQTSALATMTIDEAEAWVDANIDDPKVSVAFKHMLRMMFGMRDWIMADIRGQQADS